MILWLVDHGRSQLLPVICLVNSVADRDSSMLRSDKSDSSWIISQRDCVCTHLPFWVQHTAHNTLRHDCLSHDA